MARLITVNESPVSNSAKISGGVQSLGSSEVALGEQFEAASRRANTSLQLTRAMTQATEQFSAASNQRMQRVTDDEGNPSYSTLKTDVERIGQEVMGSVGSKITDSEASRQFAEKFGIFLTNKSIIAQQTARRQQVDFSRAQLNNSLDSWKQQAIQGNPEQISEYEHLAQGQIQDSVSSGIISAQEAENLRKNFQSTVRVESYRNVIAANPEKALKEFQDNKPSSLGLTEQEKDRLSLEAEAAVRDKERELKRAEAARESDLKEHQNINEASLELDLIEGRATEKDILGAANSGQISELQKLGLLKKLAISRGKEDSLENSTRLINESIQSGSLIPPTVSSSQINKHFQARLQKAQEGSEGNLTLSQKSALVAQYRAPVTSFRKELETLAISEDSDGVQVMQAYRHLVNTKSMSIAGMNPESEAILSAASAMVDGGINPVEAMRRARLSAQNPEKKALLREFSKIEDFKLDEIRETIEDELDAVPWFSGAKLAPGVESRAVELMKNAYVLSGGDKSAAIKFMSANLERTHGYSKLTNRYMMAPPEMFYPRVESSELKRSLNSDLAGLIPEDSEVVLVSYPGTTTNMSDPSWLVTYIDSTGTQVPVLSEAGEMLTWKFDIKEKTKEGLDKAKQTRVDAIQNQKNDEKRFRNLVR